MQDPLLTRARLTIDESYSLRERRRALIEQQKRALADLRLAMWESAMTRVEIKALRENSSNLRADSERGIMWACVSA